MPLDPDENNTLLRGRLAARPWLVILLIVIGANLSWVLGPLLPPLDGYDVVYNILVPVLLILSLGVSLAHLSNFRLKLLLPAAYLIYFITFWLVRELAGENPGVVGSIISWSVRAGYLAPVFAHNIISWSIIFVSLMNLLIMGRLRRQPLADEAGTGELVAMLITLIFLLSLITPNVIGAYLIGRILDNRPKTSGGESRVRTKFIAIIATIEILGIAGLAIVGMVLYPIATNYVHSYTLEATQPKAEKAELQPIWTISQPEMMNYFFIVQDSIVAFYDQKIVRYELSSGQTLEQHTFDYFLDLSADPFMVEDKLVFFLVEHRRPDSDRYERVEMDLEQNTLVRSRVEDIDQKGARWRGVSLEPGTRHSSETLVILGDKNISFKDRLTGKLLGKHPLYTHREATFLGFDDRRLARKEQAQYGETNDLPSGGVYGDRAFAWQSHTIKADIFGQALGLESIGLQSRLYVFDLRKGAALRYYVLPGAPYKYSLLLNRGSPYVIEQERDLQTLSVLRLPEEDSGEQLN